MNLFEDFVEENTTYEISCSCCGSTYNDLLSADEAIKIAVEKGWQVVDEKLYCNDCLEDE